MSLRVVIHREAQDDMDEYLSWLKPRAPQTTAIWFSRLQAHIFSLSRTAQNCARAAEFRKSSRDLRESYFGRRPYVFRIVFYLETDAIHVIRVRRGQRRSLTRRAIEEAIDSEPTGEEPKQG